VGSYIRYYYAHPHRTIMSALLISLFVCRALTSNSFATQTPLTLSTCRNVPGNPGYPTNEHWEALNTTVSGRLVEVVPFVEFCNIKGGCTAEQSSSSSFRAGVPGAMSEVSKILFRFLGSTETDAWFCSQIGNRLDPCSWMVLFYRFIVCLGLLFGPTISL
jgi:hypothetical protein